jgi:hypothetical protein
METKQSSIEWLQDKLNNVKPTQFCSIETIKEWVEQAKEMHKQEIMDAWYNGFEENRPYVDHSEDYYKETYKQD